MGWSPQQSAALMKVERWLREPGGPQVLTLSGYAGTGKTTLAKEIAETVPGTVIFCAFTGKAALVLRQKGCDGARTIHSLIYRPIERENEPPRFERNDDSDAYRASLIIVDECSMVDEALGRDLLSFGRKVLVLGDPGQLPPVKGSGFFTSDRPDIMLTEIHRQARDNPIIHLSMAVREGRALSAGRYGDSEVVAKGHGLDTERVLAADQVLVGRNVTRRSYNKGFRQALERGSPYPIASDKLVCLRNDRDKGLLNGGLWTVERLTKTRGTTIGMRVVSEDGDGEAKINVRPEFFDGREDSLEWAERKRSDEFTFGYALTVHKAQGSQWDDVIVVDESTFFREHRANHLYTAITRAAQKVTVKL